jgi:cysteine-rich repeat protein
VGIVGSVRFVGFVLLAALASCLEPALVACPDGVACPEGTVCGPSGGCFTPEQLTSCEDIADGEPCDGGFCVERVCVPVGCGNRARTPDEACDDGNSINGDGCSADCLSDETCGNGTTDLAAGEQCDDGNDDAGDACEPGCMLPRCGDGYVDGIEECDPGVVLSTTRTCEDFGYYAGELTCNDICRLDPTTSCVGRCGDGIVQSTREDCDSGPPANTCVEYGYDVGVLACSLACAADPIRSCDRYGWKSLGMSGAPVRIAADGDLAVSYVNNAPPFHVYEGGTTTLTGAGFVGADVRDGVILRASPTEVHVRAAGSTTFEVLPAPGLLGDQRIVDAVLADSDGTPIILVSTSSTCEVKVFTGGAWTTTPTFAGCMRLVARSATNFIAYAPFRLEWHFPGGTRTHDTSGIVQIDFEPSASSIAIYMYNTNMVTYLGLPTVGPGSSTTTIATGSFAYVGIVGEIVYGVDTSLFGTQLYRRTRDGRVEQIEFSPSTNGAPNAFGVGRDGRLYGGTNAQLYRFQHVARTARTLPASASGDISQNTAFATAPDGTLFFCGTQLWRSTATGWEQLTTVGLPCYRAFARSATEVYVQRGASNPPLSRLTGSTTTNELLDGSPFSVQRITGDATILLATTTTSILRKVATTWAVLPALPAGCAIPGALAAKDGVAYAGSNCSGVATIFRYDGSAWVTVHAEANAGSPSSMIVLADDTIWVATGTLVVMYGTEGGTWTRLDGGGQTVAAAGDRIFAATPSRVNEWTGSQWSVIRTLPNLSIHHFHTTKTDLIVGGPVLNPPTIKFVAFAIPP